DDRLADAVDVAAGGQVHDGVGAEVDGGVELVQFVVDLAGDGGVADVGVDLTSAGDADRHRLQPLGQVDLVGRDDHAPAGDLGADQLGVEILAAGDVVHLGGGLALAGDFELCHRRGSSRASWWRVRTGGREGRREGRAGSRSLRRHYPDQVPGS